MDLNNVMVFVIITTFIKVPPHLTKVAHKCYHQTPVIDKKTITVHTVDKDTGYYGFRMIRNTDDTYCLCTPMAVSALYLCNTF